ncbi:MAG: tetratricopeptide repeat protein [Candidatus Omnitrophica bacterium]|nr:tetratricopeptide repeat protein [Candidatus Omnitrophota bacterium]
MTVFNRSIEKKDLFAILFVFTLALSIRIFYLADYKKSEVYPVFTYSDAWAYADWGRDIASGDLAGHKVFMKWPFYAYFLGLLFSLSKNSVPAVYLLQSILGAANCILVYFIALRLFNRRTAFISGLVCVFYGLFLFYDGLLIYNSLALFLNSLLFLQVLHIKDNLSARNLFWTGVFLGVCAITQAGLIIFGVLALLWVLYQKKGPLINLTKPFLYFFAGLSLILGAVTFRNYLVGKDFVLISANTGINFYLGNNPKASGTFSCPPEIAASQEGMFRDARVIARAVLKKDLKESEVSRFWFRKSLSFIKSNLPAYLKLESKKLFYFFNPRESVHEAEYSYLFDKIRVFKVAFTDLTFILPLGIMGMFLAFKDIKRAFLLYLEIFSFLLISLLFFTAARYRVIIVPFLIIFASLAVCALAEALFKRRYLQFARFSLLVIFLCIFLNSRFLIDKFRQPKGAVTADFESLMAKSQFYLSKGDPQQAIKYTRLACLKQPMSHYCVVSLGAIYYSMGDFKAAEEKFKEALGIFDLSVDAYYNLGVLYNEQGRFVDAKEALEQALYLDPQDIGAHFELGKAYKAIGKAEAARNELNLVLNKLSRWRKKEREDVQKELDSLL